MTMTVTSSIHHVVTRKKTGEKKRFSRVILKLISHPDGKEECFGRDVNTLQWMPITKSSYDEYEKDDSPFMKNHRRALAEIAKKWIEERTKL